MSKFNHSKLVFQKKIIVHVNVNVNSSSKFNSLHWFFLKKHIIHFNE